MKFYILILFLFIYLSNAYGQGNQIMGITKYQQPIYANAFSDLKQLHISTPYALVNFDSSFVNLDFKSIEVLAYDLVYTQHPKNLSHDKLNERRLLWLQKNIPSLLSAPLIKKRIIEQTAAQTKEDAEKLFHGFIIYYRETGKINYVAKEIEKIKSILNGTFKKPNNPKLSRPIQPNAGLSYVYTCYTPDMLNWYKKSYSDVVVHSKKTMIEKKLITASSNVPNCDSFVVSFFAKPNLPDNDDIYADSTVLNSINRNKWKAGIYCMDVTASMSPYTAQMLLWLKQKSKKVEVKRFYFFNDGDNKPEHEKPIGHTGGIYQCLTDKLDVVSKTMFRAMEYGTGGDKAENNIECLVKAQSDHLYAQEIILVADNWAPVRDMELLPFIKIPVRVILCGNKGNVLVDYLNIAYATKGSLHTQYEDLKDITKLRDGDIFTYGSNSYRLIKGKFIQL
jgi:hypothetical protein